MSQTDSAPGTPQVFRVTITDLYRLEDRGKGSPVYIPIHWSVVEVTVDEQRRAAMVTVDEEGVGAAVGSIIDTEREIYSTLVPGTGRR